ncbi:MAG: glycoside hydrolase family 99-like domain-containing protein, partial [Acidobacteria bacterium]|nr:glycoside hydrolase family 99-like domain-containing protein [Acidobacteriota bacterium]
MIFDVPAEHYRKIIFSVNYVALGKDGYSFLLKNKNNELSELTCALKIKEEELVSISTVLKDKEAELVSISTVLKDKEAELVKQKVATQKQFADHVAQIQQLKQQLNEAKNLLNRILLSSSWKVTGPMRWARRILSTLSWKLAISLRQLRRNMRIIPARFDLGRLSSGSGQKDICINVAHITTDNVQMDLIRNSGLFDDKYYNQSYPDIEKVGIDALQHYYYYGWKEGRNPSVYFNTQYYLDSNEAVRKANINPLLHYIKFGKAQVLGEQCRHIQEIEIQDTFEPPYPIDIPRNDSPVKTIAFYLPQYHPIPENDAWWGKNFTDWTNVSKAKPNFEGHYQPHLPYDLGFYDLRIPSVIEQQISMAKSFGIYGFCFYYYWFAGKILLEKPLKIFLENKDFDINFCLCWANENWTRRWDGQESDILIAQKHSDDDDLAFIENISKYLNDHRYIRINGKPLLLVYRPKLFPDMKKTVKIWRNFCRAKDIGEIYVGMCQTFGEYNPLIYDLDFAVEFPPHNIPAAEITSTITTIDKYSGHIYDGNTLVKKIAHSLNQKPSYNWFRCVMMNWDNTARKGLKGHTYLGITPAKFGEWFWKACQFSIKYQPCNERFVFINAWNEWAEGTHLEPCRKMGYSYLNQIGKVIKKISYKNGKETLVSIVVPTFNAEKFIAETLLSIVHQTHPCIEIVIVDDGSSDDTRAIVNDFVEANQDVKIVTHFQANQGAHAAINKGIEIATGEILAICNHDDFFAKNRIEIMVNEMLRNDSEMAFSRVKVNILNAQNKDGKNLKKTIDNKVSSILEFPNIGYALLDFNVAISSGNLIFSKNIWKKIGGFQNLKYCHDWMFALQALNHTTPVFVNMELYEYQIHENNTFRDLTHLAEKETQLVLESFFNERLWTEKTKKFFSDRYYFDNFINNRNYRKYFSSDLSKQASKYKH